MASSINASTTAGVVTTADTSGVLNIQTAGTTAIAIDASQAVTFAGAVSLSGNQTITGNLTVNGNTTLGDASTDTILMTGAPSIGGAGLGMGMGFRNRIINGAMVIDQRNAGAAVTLSSDLYVVDRFTCRAMTSLTSTAQQSSTAPTGFSKSLLYTVGTGATAAAGDRNTITQAIEGFNTADLGWGAAGAATVTLSFWVRSSVTGTFGGALANGTLARSYPFTYTISVANTFEYKTITVAGDTSGTWATTNSAGIYVWFDMGCGATYLGTAGAWAGADYRGATGDTKLVATTGATFYITGVQLEKGSTATSFDYRDYGRELMLCQRYLPAYTLIAGQNIVAAGMAYNSTTCIIPISLPVSARVYPTGVTYTGTATNVQVVTGSTIINCTAFNFNSGSSNTTAALNMLVASITTGASVLLVTPVSTSGTFYFTGCEL